MGKTTTAGLFTARGIPVWDADKAVARAYGPNGPATGPLESAFPGCTGPDGVDRGRLRAVVSADPGALARIEAIVHPLVRRDREEFIDHTSSDIVVLDIPLLFETSAEAWLDSVIVVSVPPDLQRKRVLARPEMTPERFELLNSRQMPDAEKRRRADHVIDTSDMDSARKGVDDVLTAIREKLADARNRS